MGRGLLVSPCPPPPILLAVFFAVVVKCLLPYIPPLLLPAIFFFFPPPSSFTSLRVLLLVVSVFVFLFCCVCRFHYQGRQGSRLHTCVRKIQRIWWIHCDRSRTFQTRAAEVSSTAVRGGFDRFLMTPWMACQNPSKYKNRAALT